MGGKALEERDDRSPPLSPTPLRNRRLGLWDVAVTVLAVSIVYLWGRQALVDTFAFDIGLAYRGGQEAWASGHPERLDTWISTPFLGMVMAIVSRLLDEAEAARGITVMNLAIGLTLSAAVLRGLWHRVPAPFWRVLLLALAVFAPLVSSIWLKQFNLIVFALALASVPLARGGRPLGSGLVAALSVLLKPIVILLPVALLLRRESRRAGWWSMAWLASLSAVAQGFLAVRAGTLSALSPLPALTNFTRKSLPDRIWVCDPDNFSPLSMMCRIAGPSGWTYQRVAVIAFALCVAALANHVVRDQEGCSWEVFAFASALSPLFSPIAWSHYQLLLAPMLVLLAYRFTKESASWPYWAGLGLAVFLVELSWRPYSTLPGALNEFLNGEAETNPQIYAVLSYAMFAQYVVLGIAVCWYKVGGRREGALA